MNVSRQAELTARRVAQQALALAVRHWPEESRTWGQALAAELEETTGTWDTLRWMIGGLMFFARSVVSSGFAWLKLPIGGRRDTGSGGAMPRRSRLATAVILIAVGVVLCLPVTREAMRTVRGSWNGFDETSSDRRALEKLAQRAEKENDAGALAFVALELNDPTRAKALADHAVALDPALVWIYGANGFGWPRTSGFSRWQPGEELARKEVEGRLEKWQAADPNNAVPYILLADLIARTRFEASPIDFEKQRAALANDPEWMALMERAYAAPRYDGYYNRHFQLANAVWNRERQLSLGMVLRQLWSHPIPNLMNLRQFADIQADRAKRAYALGDLAEAERLLGGVDAFGERMGGENSTDIERLIALGLVRNANEELAKIYGGAGQPAEAEKAQLRVKELEQHQRQFRSRHPLAHAWGRSFVKWGIFVHCFAGLAILAGLAALAGILAAEAWPKRFADRAKRSRRMVCWMADYAPVALLVSCGGFLVSFLPYERTLEAYRASESAFAGEMVLGGAMMGLFTVPRYVLSAGSGETFWMAVIVVLVALALFILVRGAYRLRTKHT